MLQNFFLRHLQYNRQTRRFFMTIIALGFTLDGIYAVLLNLYLLRLGYGTEFIGQVNAIGLLVFAVMSLPAGLFGARWTSTQMLRVGVGIILLGMGFLPFAEFSPAGWQDGWFIVNYALILTGFSLYFVNGAPFLMGVVSEDKQNNAFALQTALLSFAAFAGSLIGGNLPGLIAQIQGLTLDNPAPYRYTLLIASVVIAIASLITLTIHEQVDDEPESQTLETDNADVQQKPKRKNQGFTWSIILLIGIMSAVRFLQVAGIGTATVYFNVYMDTQLAIATGTIGTIAAIGRLIAVPTVLLAPRLIRRWGTGAVAVGASLATALFLVPLALVPNWTIAALSYIGVLAVTNLRFTAFIVYIMVLVPKRQQSVMAGAGEMAAGGSFALMALGGGYILAVFSFRDLFLLGAFLSALGTLIFWLHLRFVKTH